MPCVFSGPLWYLLTCDEVTGCAARRAAVSFLKPQGAALRPPCDNFMIHSYQHKGLTIYFHKWGSMGASRPPHPIADTLRVDLHSQPQSLLPAFWLLAGAEHSSQLSRLHTLSGGAPRAASKASHAMVPHRTDSSPIPEPQTFRAEGNQGRRARESQELSLIHI